MAVESSRVEITTKILRVSGCLNFPQMASRVPFLPFLPGDLPLPHTFNVKLGCTPSVQSLLQLLVISFLMLHHTTCPSV